MGKKISYGINIFRHFNILYNVLYRWLAINISNIPYPNMWRKNTLDEQTDIRKVNLFRVEFLTNVGKEQNKF